MSLSVDIQLKRDDFVLSFNAEFAAPITGLFGPSGSGKTTLLHCIAGLKQPDSGQIKLDDEILYDNILLIHMPTRKRRMGLVFPHLTVEGNLKYGQSGPRKQRKDKRCEIAELLEIRHLLKRKPATLSGGQKQRVALGRAILNSPRLLLLDEPFTGLDQGLKQQLIPYLRKLYETTRIPMILVSHSPEDIAHMTDEIVFIENGRFFAQGKFKQPKYQEPIGRFCGLGKNDDLSHMRNHLIKNHTLRFGCHENVKAI